MSTAVKSASLSSFVRESAVYGAGIALARGLGLLLTPVLARVFDAREFGVLDLLQTGGLLASTLLSLSMESALLRYYHDAADRAVLVSTYLIAQLVIGLAFLAALLIGGLQLIALYTGFDDPATVWMAAASVVTGLLYVHAMTVLRAERVAGHAATVMAVNAGLNVAVVAGLLVGVGAHLVSVFAARAISDAACTIWVIARYRRLYALRFSTAWLWRLVRFGLPLAPDGILTFVSGQLGKLFLLGSGSVADVGLLAVATRIATGLRLILTSFRQAWLPYVFSIAGRPEADATYATVLQGYMRVTVALLSALVVLSPEAVTIIAGERYLAARPLLGIVGAGVVVVGLPYLFNVGLLLAEQTRFYTVGLLASSIVVVGAGWFLVDAYGIFGAAWAPILGGLTLAASVLFFAQRARPIPYDLRRLAGFIVIVFALAAIGTSSVERVPLIIRAPLLGLVGWALVKDGAARTLIDRWRLRRTA